jgi:hypothetical protein
LDKYTNDNADMENVTLQINLYEPCPKQFSFWNYYDSLFPYSYRNPVLTVSWDLHSITTALALNMGIINFDGLTPVFSPYGPKVGGNIAGTFYIDEYFAPMEPVFCVNLTSLRDSYGLNVTNRQLNGPPICVLVHGPFYAPTYFLPMISSMSDASNHCSCPRDINDRNCNAQDFIVSTVQPNPINIHNAQIISVLVM